MIATSSRDPKGLELGGAIVALAMTIFAWQMLSRATANMLVASEQAGVALAVRPSDGAALTSLAALAIAAPPRRSSATDDTKIANARASVQLADAALTGTPLDPLALRLLAQSAELSGNKTRAERLMKVAGKQTIRDTIVNIYLLTLYASRKDYAKAFDSADALLRLTPGVGENVYPLIDTIAVNPEAQPALIALLGRHPPWSAAFLSSMASRLTKPEDFLDVIVALKDGPSPLTDAELRAYLDPLIARGLFEQAYDTWLQLLPPRRLENLRYVSNGGFDSPLTNLPFDWTITPIDGATASFDKSPGREDRALHVQFEDRRVAFRNVAQMVMLPAGTYRLTGSYRAEGLNNARGMTWRLYCAERSDGKPIAETPSVLGTSDDWEPFETSFKVPEDHCRAQWLRLEVASRIAVEQELSGAIWYDDIAISKAPDTEPHSDSSAAGTPALSSSPTVPALRRRGR